MKILGEIPPARTKVGFRRLQLCPSEKYLPLIKDIGRLLDTNNIRDVVLMLKAQGEVLPTEGYIRQLPRITMSFDYLVASEEWYEEGVRQEIERSARIRANHVTYEMMVEDCKACNAFDQKWMAHWRSPEMGHWAVCSLEGEADPSPVLFDGFGSCINYLIHECGAEYPVNDDLHIDDVGEVLKQWCEDDTYQLHLQNIKSRGSFARVRALFNSDQLCCWYSIEWFKEPLKGKDG
jgi:hypothetical protein